MSKQQSAGAIAPWRGRFTSPSLESAYLRDQGSVIAHELARSLSFCAVFYLAFALADLIVSRSGAATIFADANAIRRRN